MRVFLSWSGKRSQAVAEALAALLPEVLQDLRPWVSSHSIAAGSRWIAELTSELESGHFGILCLTRENVNAPWLLFEAGALAKSMAESRVVPYMIDLSEADVPYPLAQFQGVTADESGTLALIKSLNAARESPMDETRLQRIFARWWPDMYEALNEFPTSQTDTSSMRSEKELLEEVLNIVRQNASSQAQAMRDLRTALRRAENEADHLRWSLRVATEPGLANLNDNLNRWHLMDMSSLTLEDTKELISDITEFRKSLGPKRPSSVDDVSHNALKRARVRLYELLPALDAGDYFSADSTWELIEKGPGGEDYIVRCKTCGKIASFDPRWRESPPDQCPRCKVPPRRKLESNQGSE